MHEFEPTIHACVGVYVVWMHVLPSHRPWLQGLPVGLHNEGSAAGGEQRRRRRCCRGFPSAPQPLHQGALKTHTRTKTKRHYEDTQEYWQPNMDRSNKSTILGLVLKHGTLTNPQNECVLNNGSTPFAWSCLALTHPCSHAIFPFLP